MCRENGIGKLSLLRQLCKKTGKAESSFQTAPTLVCVCVCVYGCSGVQMLLRDYDFSHFPVFTDDDIAAVFPVVMHTDFKVSVSH